MPDRATRIQSLLTRAFAPTVMELTDDSSRHAGHLGARPEGETHFRLLMVSPAFRGQSRMERSRAVHAVLAPEFQSGLHAIALTLRAPEEHASAGNDTGVPLA